MCHLRQIQWPGTWWAQGFPKTSRSAIHLGIVTWITFPASYRQWQILPNPCRPGKTAFRPTHFHRFFCSRSPCRVHDYRKPVSSVTLLSGWWQRCGILWSIPLRSYFSVTTFLCRYPQENFSELFSIWWIRLLYCSSFITAVPFLGSLTSVMITSLSSLKCHCLRGVFLPQGPSVVMFYKVFQKQHL